MTDLAVDFYAFMADAEARRIELGIAMDEAAVDAMRNKGFRRTAPKRALLRAVAERSRREGLEPPVAYIDGKRV